jgi:osmotically-inducible protein OsmY
VHDKVSTPSPPADDNTLADRVRSEIFRHTAVHSGTVNVGVSRGVVYLRGQVETEEQAEQLAAEARRVPGVIGVQSLLHTAGTPTPHGGAA